MSKRNPPAIVIQCATCNKQLVWSLEGFNLNVIGIIQVKCLTCGQVVSWPKQAVWGLAKRENEENLAARLLGDVGEVPDL